MGTGAKGCRLDGGAQLRWGGRLRGPRCEHTSGKGGGGRPDMAQAGGPDASKLQEALDAVSSKLGELAKR